MGSIASMLLSACGGGSGSENSVDEFEPEDLQASSVPLGDSVDTQIDPNTLVDDAIQGVVWLQGAPLSHAQVNVYNHDGSKILGTATTDASGAYSISAQALACMRTVVSTALGELSGFDRNANVSHPGLSYVNELTTLVDRLRIRKGWTVSQAEDRIQDFLSIPRVLPTQADQQLNTYFGFTEFEAARLSAGLTLNAFIDRLVDRAVALNFMELRQQFPRMETPSPELIRASAPATPAKPGFSISDIASALGYLSSAYSGAQVLLSALIADKDKTDFANGWFLKLGLVDDTSYRIDTIIATTNQILFITNEIYNKLVKAEVETALRTISPAKLAFQKFVSDLAIIKQLIQSGNSIDNKLQTMISITDDGSLYRANAFYDDYFNILTQDSFNIGKVEVQSLIGQISQNLYENKNFWSHDSYIEYKFFIDDLRKFNLILGIMRLLYMSFQSKKDNGLINVTAKQILARDKVFELLTPKAFVNYELIKSDLKSSWIEVNPEGKYVFIDFAKAERNVVLTAETDRLREKDWVWFMSPSLDEYYDGWYQSELMSNFSQKYPDMKNFGGWSVPSKDQINASFFAPISKLPKNSKNFADFVKSKGASSLGLYSRELTSRKNKNLNIWLDDAESGMHTPAWGSATRGITYYWKRSYARLGHIDFKSITYDCKSMDIRCSINNVHPGKDKNYFFPVCKNPQNMDAYLPWRIFIKVKHETKNFNPDEIFKLMD